MIWCNTFLSDLTSCHKNEVKFPWILLLKFCIIFFSPSVLFLCPTMLLTHWRKKSKSNFEHNLNLSVKGSAAASPRILTEAEKIRSDLQKSLLFHHPQNLSTLKRLCIFAVGERALCFHYKNCLERGQCVEYTIIGNWPVGFSKTCYLCLFYRINSETPLVLHFFLSMSHRGYHSF